MNPSTRRLPLLVAVLLGLSLAGTVASAQVVINEIHYNPPGDDATVQLEFIELHNLGPSSVDVGLHRLVFGPEPVVFPVGTTIPAGGYLVVAERIPALQASTGHTAALEWYGLNTGLGNGSDQVDLLDPALALLDRVAYTDSAPWPTTPDGSGPSLELTHPALDNALAGSWTASVAANGTPGALNSTYSSAPTVSAETPNRGTAVGTLAAVQVTFSDPVSGVVAANLTVNGSAATTVDCPTCVGGLGAGPYTFTGFAPPLAGSAAIVLAPGIIESGGLPFAGDSWTVSVGVAVVFNELHYHPPDPNGDAEFVEFHNPGTNPVDMSGWAISEGLAVTFGSGTVLSPGGFLVVALNPTLLQSLTGYAGALPWTSGRLSNGGEKLILQDASGNTIDTVDFGDSGDWPTAPDGDGPTLELINPRLPNQYGSAWVASLGGYGTPGTANSTYDPAPKPIITGVLHAPAIPAGGQSVTITARVLDDVAVTAVTLYYRQDQDPTVAYATVAMLDDGAHGDGAAGDDLYGASVSGLPDGARLDFTLRADDGVGLSAAPAGHNTLVAGEYPAQTYLAKFSNTPPPTDFPSYHLVTTQRTRALQEAHNEDEHDATFLRCDTTGCQIFYNVVERYRGQSSLNQHPHSFRVNFPSNNALESEMGFDVTRLNLHAQTTDKQHLGYEFFREAFGGSIPTSRTQFVRLHTSPLSHGGIQDFVYINVERVDDDFLASQAGNVVPLRFPDRCSVSRTPCETATDCPGGESCVATDDGNLYRGRLSGDLQYLGTNKESYRGSYDKETNADADAWTDLIDQCFALDPDTTGDASYEAAVSAIADEDEWARWLAINMLLVNQEGGIYRDTGDDYYLYFLGDGSPFGREAQLLPVDLDSVFGGAGGSFSQETIWRTNVQATQRFVRSNAFAGRFVGAICQLYDTDFRPEVLNPRIDALPDVVANAARKQALKDWVVARRSYVAAEIRRDLTLTGVPASPYVNANPVISVGGQVNQCGTRFVTVNDVPATFSVFNASWSANVTLGPGPNTIVVRNLDHFGNEIEREEATVTYAPPGGTSLLRLTMPRRMLADRTQTIRAEIIDSLGRIVTSGCPQWGTISVRRLSDSSVVPVSVTQFDSHLAIPDDGIRFYNGLGTVSFTLDGGTAVGSGDVDVSVTVNGITASRIVSVEAAPVFRALSGGLSGAGLTWGPDENIRITGNTSVPGGSTLNILPGTLIMVDTTGGLDNGTLIQVDGTIAAAGTADKPIHFFSERGQAAMTLTQSGSASNAEAWQGIFHNGSGSSTYDYVFLTGAGNGTVISHPRPPILRFNSGHSFTMNNSTLADNNGMTLAGPGTGSYTVRNTSISRCGIGAEFNGNGHNLLIEDTWWTSCGHAPEPNNLDGDLIHIDGASSTQMIRRSILADGGDDGIDHSASTYTAQSLIIYGIVDKAVSMTGGFGNFSNVLIYGSGSGIRGAASCTNCTIAVGSPIASPNSVQNSIIWPSSLATCASNIDYTDVGNPVDLGCGDGNLSSDPLYENTGLCNYAPAAGSPVLTAGPSGERIGWLGFPEAFTCQTGADCNDANPCTLDSCGAAGVCVFESINGCSPCTGAAECEDGDPCTANSCGAEGTCQSGPAADGTSCDDGVACTLDACSAGACVGTPDCPANQTCNSGSGLCEQIVLPQTVTFQQGVGGYTGVQDTYVAEAATGTNYGAVADWRWDTDDPSGSSSDAFGLVRFDGIFGGGPGQIPPGATIQSATLTLVVFNNSVAPAGEVRQSLVDWSEGAATWANFGGEAGVQADEYGATVVAAAPIAVGAANIDVTPTLQSWSGATSTNLGWIFVPLSTDGLQVRSSEYATVADGPKLSVTYVVSAGCTTHIECDDNDLCNGAETCAAGSCLPGTALVCDDGNPCTADACDAGTGCTAPPVADGTACADADFCNGAESCQAGTCTAGAVPSCDDGVACTADSCEALSGCGHVSTCAPGQTCNAGSGLCESGPQTVTFQDGGTYSGTQDTWLGQATPGTPNGAAVSWGWDSENPAPSQDWGLLRFDGLFGGGVGQIPPGSTIQSATLTLVVTEPGVAPAGDVHLSLVDWSEATATWDNFGGDAGVQADEIGALAGTAPFNTGAATLDVTASLQTWLTNPAAHFGWLFKPNSNNGVDVSSAENAAAAERPKLVVTFVPPASNCTTNEQCDDGLFCNGAEICTGGACLAGAPPCDDGLSCTTDSCDEPTNACAHTSCTVTAIAAGPRYLSVTPPAGLAAVALRVSAPGLSCLPRYVDAGGRIVDAPVFQSSAAWGTVSVADEEIVPATTYTVQAESSPGVGIGSASATTWAWGDATNAMGVNVFDILCVARASLGNFAFCALTASDLAPAVPDGVVDSADTDAVRSAFSGAGYPDADPCDGLAPLAPAQAPMTPARAPGQGAPASLLLVPRTSRLGAGEVVSVDVYGRGVADLRAYRVALEATSATGRPLEPDALHVDLQRGDYLFHGMGAYPQVDTRNRTLGGALVAGSASASSPRYLGTYVFRAGPGTSGPSFLSVRVQSTVLVRSDGRPLDVELPPAVRIDVARRVFAAGGTRGEGD